MIGCRTARAFLISSINCIFHKWQHPEIESSPTKRGRRTSEFEFESIASVLQLAMNLFLCKGLK